MSTDLVAGVERLATRYRGIDAVLFDFDGTLYEDIAQFGFYAHQLAAAVPRDRRRSFWQQYRAIRQGRHPVRMGSVVDLERDWVLTQRMGRVTAVHTWYGVPVPQSRWQGDYPVPLWDCPKLRSVGDLWQVAPVCALRCGVPADALTTAFLTTRDWLARRRLIPVPGLAVTLDRLRRRCRLVLATNSPEPDSRQILAHLGLEGAFDQCFFRSGKPNGFLHLAGAMTGRCGAPSSDGLGRVLSIGDNLLNDIVPAQRLGMRTLFIDRFGQGHASGADGVVPDLIRMTALLQTLADLA